VGDRARVPFPDMVQLGEGPRQPGRAVPPGRGAVTFIQSMGKGFSQ